MTGDVLIALRLLRRSPTYGAVVVATLALGIGGVAAVFTLADPMIFRPLPYADSNRIVDVRGQTRESAADEYQVDSSKPPTVAM
jgi:hypothetical protein